MENSQQNIGWYFSISEKYRFGFILGALLTLCAFFAFSPSPASALTTVPTKMNFQGRLTDNTGNIKANGTYNMKLRLYTVNSGGSAVWTEDRLVSAGNGVTVTNGLFSIQLGSVTSLPASLFASGALYLEVELPTPATATTSGTPTWTEGAMTPRNQMATSAYAYNAETLDGIDSAAFGQLNGDNQHWGGYNYFDSGAEVSGPFFGVFSDEIFFNPTTYFSVLGELFEVKSGTAVFKNYMDTTNAFSIQNLAGNNLFNVNTTNSIVRIGNTTADATGIVFVLDTKNTSGDPTGIVGATYYNSNTGKFRCYQVSSWKNCDDGGNSTTIDGLDSTAFGLLSGSNTWSGVNAFSNNANFDSGTLFVDSANNRVGIGTSSPNAALNILGQSNYAATNTPSYSCDPGGSYNGDGTCNYTYQNGSPPCAPYEYDGGDGYCYENVTLPANVTNNYSCPNGGTLSGTTCILSAPLFNIETNSTRLLTVDSAGTIRIGAATADGTGTVLIFDTKNTAGDPTGTMGAMYYNSSMKRFRCYGETKWVDCRSSAASNTAVSSVTNTTTETQFTGVYTAEANECVAGRTYRVTARGTYSQAALATNLTMKLKWGSAVLTSTGAQAMGAVAMTNQQWTLETDVVCQTTGASGTVEAMGSFERHTAATTSTEWAMANTGPVTVNTTVSANIAVTAQWSVANAGNSITLRTLTINSLDNGN